MVFLSCTQYRLVGTHRHRIVATEDGVDVRICLHHRLHHLHRLVLIEVGRLLRKHMEILVTIDHRMESSTACPGIVVANNAENLDIIAAAIHYLDEVLSQLDAAGIVIG